MNSRNVPGVPRAITTLCIGTSPLGGTMGEIYGNDAPAERAEAAIAAAVASPIRFMDTSNGYGDAERRIGRVLGRVDVPDDFVLATKADPSGRDFSGDRVRASFVESCERLGRDRFDIFYLHDPEVFDWDYLTAPGGAVTEMIRLKEEGLVGAIGVAGGDLANVERYLNLGVFDVVLNHNQFTLLDQSAEDLMDKCVTAGVGFVNAAPFASGLLARPNDPNARYQYRTPDDSVRSRLAIVQELCNEFGVEVAAAALRFSTRDERVGSTVVGISRPERVEQLLAHDAADIPDDIWREFARRTEEGTARG